MTSKKQSNSRLKPEEFKSHLENILAIPKMEKKIVPEHPYCTNWPVGEKKNEDI